MDTKKMQDQHNNAGTKKCAVCSGTDIRPLYRGLVRCRECTFVWADLTLDAEDLRDIYGKNYFWGAEYTNYPAEEKILKRNFQQVLDHILRLKPLNGQKPKLLEIGCAYGYFLDVAKKTFITEGIELNAEAAEHAADSGHKIYQTDFLSADLAPQSYDVIVSLAVMEHIQDADLHVEKIAQCLKPGGLFYLSTCDIDSLFARICGPRWRLIYPPTHLSYWSVATLKKILSRYGLETLDHKKFWQRRAWDAILKPLLVDRFGAQSLYNFLDWVGVTQMAFRFNVWDSVFLGARKR